MKRRVAIVAIIAFAIVVACLGFLWAVYPSNVATRIWIGRSPARVSKEPRSLAHPLIRWLYPNSTERFFSEEEWQRAGKQIRGIQADLLVLLNEDNDAYTRFRIIWGMGLVSGEESVPYLITILENDSSSFQCEAAWALARIGDVRAIVPLRRSLGSTDSDVCNAASEALKFAGW